MSERPGAMSEEDGKKSFTRTSGAAVLAVLLLVFAWTAYKAQWPVVESMFQGLLLLVWGLYFTNKGPAMLGALKGAAQPQPTAGQPSVAPQP